MGMIAGVAIFVLTALSSKFPDLNPDLVFLSLCAFVGACSLASIAGKMMDIRDTLEDWKGKAHPEPESDGE